MPTLRIFFTLSFILTAAILHAELTVKPDTETGGWLISENETPVLQYNYETVPLPEGFPAEGDIYAVPRSDYIHPLFDLDGEPITLDWAHDHAHHRGIYWAWPEVGYKNQFADLHALQNVFARPNGRIIATKDGENMKITAKNAWMWNDEEPIIHETAIITVHPLDETGRKIDLEFRFTGLADEVTLARRGTELYGGLNIRMQPRVDQEIGASGTDAGLPAWVFASWKSPKSEGRTEFTVFEKADNPDYPGELRPYPEINWFQPTFPKAGTRFSLKKDETLTLRYRLWIHTDGFDDAAREKAWKEYQDEKTVLFDGASTKSFADKEGNEIDWPIVDGSLVSTPGTPDAKYYAPRSNHIHSRLHFRDAEIHVEFNMDEASNGNSGIYIHGHYEVQIINSAGKQTPDNGDIGAVYGIHAPLVNAGKDYGEWQACDIHYRAPRRDADSKIIEKGRITVWLNGQLVIDDAELDEPVSQYHPYRHGETPYLQQIEKRLLETSVGPVFLQDHDSPCRFRNVWIKPLDRE